MLCDVILYFIIFILYYIILYYIILYDYILSIPSPIIKPPRKK